jgi:hypothetical protein
MTLAFILPDPVVNAENSSLTADAQCLLIGTQLTSSSNEQLKFSGTLLTMYFLGKIEGRSSAVNLQELITDASKRISATELKSAMQRCGKELSARGAEITQIGKSLQKQSK